MDIGLGRRPARRMGGQRRRRHTLVGVRPDWRRRGLASALLRTNHAGLWEYGVRTASLWTILENPTGSVALYESLGYRITDRQPRYRKPF